YFIISAIFLYILYKGHKETRQIDYQTSSTMLQNILYANFGLVFYLIKFVLPFKLSNCYPLPDKYWGQPMLTLFRLAPLLVLGLIIFIIWKRKNKKLVFVSLFYFLNLLIVLQLTRTGPAVVADRYSYIPLIGVTYLVSDKFFDFFDRQKNKIFRIGLISISAAVVLLLSFLTWNRCGVWKNSYTLWNDAIKKYPNTFVAHNHMAIYYQQEKNYDMAIKHFNKTIDIEPQYYGPYNNLGIIYHDKKEYEKAIEYYNRGIMLNPYSHQQYYNLAYAYHKLNKLDDAVINYKKAIDLRKNYLSAINNLARALMDQKKFIEAESYIKLAIKYNPDYPHAYLAYGDLYLEQGKYNEAEEYYKKVDILIPDNPLAGNKLAVLYTVKKDYDKAIGILNGIIEKDQKNIQANLQLAKIYKQLNNQEKFKFYFNKVMEIDPSDKDVLEFKKQIDLIK
ncbi:MAG: tetratricopeptide repeat protein, partial [Spirochaetes bacterium]|nr:tetratricopeptide repeat protein [Spirochaetota bacterium]